MTTEKMKIKALAPWFGTKRNIAPKIVEIIGSHRVYWEPFCGSMSVLLAKPPCEMETVNDLHGDLINLARVIRDEQLCFELYSRLSRTLYCEQFFKEAKEKWLSLPDIVDSQPDADRAYDYFVCSWMGLNEISGTARYNYPFALRWCLGGGQGARRWKSVVESMPAWHKRLRNIVIIQKDAFEVLDKINDSGDTAIYCDPPYIEKSDKYIYDFEDQDHKRLADSLKRFEKAKVIISYYDHPKLTELYEGFEKIECAVSRQSLRNATRGGKDRKKKKKVEVLLCNCPVNKSGILWFK